MKLASKAEYYIPPDVPLDAADLIERIFIVNQNLRIRVSGAEPVPTLEHAVICVRFQVPQIVSHPFLRRVWVPDRTLPPRRVPFGPIPFNPYEAIQPVWGRSAPHLDLDLVEGVCAIMRVDDLQDMVFRLHSSS
jgi:hypothetical protein